ncbi:uncharacterized protein LTR77_009384 [Saxophila tyrrhenica]|uniref:Uncharacterized protein n=1 Tax=Saxophila tyrrhenica TaxID=1690608 RepID=A0AAV9NZV7_9PEZI|nr:hypothetical protein LTR77_009384 [Saxophila tyrrhenica]
MDDSPLSRLPRELRDMVYRLVLHQPEGIVYEHFMLYYYPTGQAGWELHDDYHTRQNPNGVFVERYNGAQLEFTGPAVLPGRGRISRFQADRKGDAVDHFGLLKTCRQVRQESKPLLFAVNDVVIPTWSRHLRHPNTPRYGPSGYWTKLVELDPLEDLIRTWRGQPPLSIVLEIQEPVTSSRLPYSLAWGMKRLLGQPGYSAFNLRLSVPFPDRFDQHNATAFTLAVCNLRHQWSPKWRADVVVRDGRKTSQRALDYFRKERASLGEEQAAETKLLDRNDMELGTLVTLFPVNGNGGQGYSIEKR